MQSDTHSLIASLVSALPYIIGALVFIGIMQAAPRLMGKDKRRRRWKGQRRNDWRSGLKVVPFAPRHDVTAGARAVPDAAEQLRIVMASDFHAQPLLNKSEKRLFEVLDRLVIELAPPGWQVMAQVSLGEILKSPSKDAFLAINSKRVDLLIVDADARPVHAIEYQGAGHHQGAAAARDAVKKEALRRAGIGYSEVVPGDTPAELRATVLKILVQAKAEAAGMRV
jgi:hypothetical protein